MPPTRETNGRQAVRQPIPHAGGHVRRRNADKRERTNGRRVIGLRCGMRLRCNALEEATRCPLCAPLMSHLSRYLDSLLSQMLARCDGVCGALWPTMTPVSAGGEVAVRRDAQMARWCKGGFSAGFQLVSRWCRAGPESLRRHPPPPQQPRVRCHVCRRSAGNAASCRRELLRPPVRLSILTHIARAERATDPGPAISRSEMASQRWRGDRHGP
jgi:hypothetical protein